MALDNVYHLIKYGLWVGWPAAMCVVVNHIKHHAQAQQVQRLQTMYQS